MLCNWNIKTASRASDELTLQDTELAEAWLVCLEALARNAKLHDSPATDTEAAKRGLTDLLLEAAGAEAFAGLKVLLAPKELTTVTYAEIRGYTETPGTQKKELLIAERTKFWQLKQNADEDSENFLKRIRLAVKQCQFKKLAEATAAEELCKV